MKRLTTRLLFPLLAFFPLIVLAQAGTNNPIAVRDSFCIMPGQSFMYNVTTNDILPPSPPFVPHVFLFGQDPCIGLTSEGVLLFNSDADDCCGLHKLMYGYDCNPPMPTCRAELIVVVKCPKPDCFLVNLEDFGGGNGTAGGPAGGCASACEHSTATYYVSYNPMNTYVWTVVGGTFVTGANPAQIDVSWGAAGNGSVSVSVNGGAPMVVCVDILSGPVASFSTSDTTICRGGDITFNNTSVGASSAFWDFGDGSTSTMFSPTHHFDIPGTYTVCLVATKNNYDAQGNPLCCCTDTSCLDIIVDSLPGPKIYCISTLCAFDSSCYWTDATNCGSYVWTVLNADGSPATFSGQGTDSICVQWGAGPNGTITLDVTGCDSAYCDDPTTVVVPIISDTSAINGPIEVCENSSATYTLPKWISTYYNWQVTGGNITSGQGTNTVVIQWGLAPGPGVIHVDYWSSFLGGLPDHDPEDCAGVADLIVDIKPQFSLNGQSLVCANSTSSVFASPVDNYTWSISPAATFVGQGTNIITINWSTAGTYIVTATAQDTTAYCNDVETFVIQVVDLAPPDSITGPLEICPGDTYAYFGHSTETGVGFFWTITGGTPASATGNPVNITWNPTGPYTISLQQYNLGSPFCMSDPIQVTVLPKTLNGPLNITGPAACTNSIKSYSATPAQHPDATYNWTVSPITAGSVVMGQGTPNVMVQWNNNPGSATLILTVKLCHDSLVKMLPINLIAPVVPNITQNGVLCPGGTATLDAGAGFTSYAWSTSSTMQTTTISSGGSYVVTTTDANGCTALDTYQANAVPGPTALITTGNSTTLCIDPAGGGSVTLQAFTSTGYSFVWFCNGVAQPAQVPPSTFIHNNTNVPATFNYWVVVTDANGCTKTSNVITVVQLICPPGGGNGCTPQSYTLTATAANSSPFCNTVNFTATASGNVTLTGWNFGDPNGNTNTGTNTNAIHTYSQAGCYNATVSGTVPQAPPGTGLCPVFTTVSICVPLAANFSFTTFCLSATFTDISTFLAGQGPVAWFWDFGDGNTSTMSGPTHMYTMPGTYMVMLTVTNSAGCQAKITLPVTVSGAPAPVITAMPVPACVGQPVAFTGSGAGLITWFWAFADGATNAAQNPSHTYLMPGTYNVTLTAQNAQGCQNASTFPVMVNAAPPPDTIAYAPGLTICSGSTVTLTAPAGTGYTYLWNTGATTQIIQVMTAGTYSVTVTNVQGCTMTPDSVTVVVLPAPQAFITGNPVICDAGCTTLSAPLGTGYTYLWLDNAGNPLVPPQTGQTLQVCDFNLLPGGYAVQVTDANGCSATSPVVVVSLAISPSFTLTATDDCEGAPPSVITLAPVQVNVVYNWNTGATGPTITVLQAGTYTVIGTDTTSGCTASASITIHPLPDLCIVPVGCYEVCNPDTICGPDGLAGYQWNLNGAPIPGATAQCYIVTQSGTYSLTGTTSFGCSATSDSLMLMVIDCGCNLDVSAVPSEGDSCCWIISYNNNAGPLYGLVIHTDDADFNINTSTIDPALQAFASNPHSISLVSSSFGDPLPEGVLDSFIVICLENAVDTPQQIIFDWYDFEFNIACSDTLYFNCPVEPDCLYLAADTIYCVDTGIVYTITVCNPIDADFNVGYIAIMPLSPSGILISPPAIYDTLNPLGPGQCRDYTFILTGTAIAGDTFCYTLTAHDVPPGEIDTSTCCMLDTVYCVVLPDCDPCDNVGVENVVPTTAKDGYCCYNISLLNNYTFDPNLLTGIGICTISPGTSLSLNNPFGSGWATVTYTPTMIQLNVVPPLGNVIPQGVVSLPELCIKTDQAPPQTIEIKWLGGDRVVCRDTIPLGCEPPCGYITSEHFVCNDDGTWTYSGVIKNTSPFTMGEAHFVFTSPVGLSGYDQTISLGALPPGGTQSFSLVIGAPAVWGDTVCFTVALHALNDDANHTHCCNFHDCIVLPECPCHCDASFDELKEKGISCTATTPPSFTYTFAPGGRLTSCDVVIWSWSDSPEQDTTYGNESITHVFLGTGINQVCMQIIRTDVNGQTCVLEICKTVIVNPLMPTIDWSVFPVPATNEAFVEVETRQDNPVNLRVIDLYGRVIARASAESSKEVIRISLKDVPNGVYWVELWTNGQRSLKQIMVHD